MSYRVASASALRWFLIPLLLAFFAAGCDQAPPAKAVARKVQAQVIPVRAAQALACRSFPAQVESLGSVTLAGKFAGSVVEIYANEGDLLKPGDPVLRIDDKELESREQGLAATVSQAALERQAVAARAAQAKTTMDRLEKLLVQKVISQDDFDKARTDYLALSRELEATGARQQNAQAQREELRALRAYTRITSPSGGVLVRRFADLGAFVAAGQPLAQVDDVSRGFDLVAQVDESMLARVRVGQPLVAVAPSLDGAPFITRVSAVIGRVDPASRTFKLKAAVPSALAGLGPGAGASAKAATEPGPSTGVGPKPGSKPGPSAGPISGPSAGPSAGPNAGLNAGLSTGPNAGPSAGPGAGPGSGPSSGPSSGPNSGPNSGPGSGPSTGMFGRVFLPASTTTKLLVPSGCLASRGDMPCVFVVDAHNTARFRVVKTGGVFLKVEIDGQTYLTDSEAFESPGAPRFVEVISGLADGERVVCSRTATLREGDQIVEAAP